MRKKRYLYLSIILLIGLFLLSGCGFEPSVYPQVKEEKVNAIRVGMSKELVDALLGKGHETFVENDKGRSYTSIYQYNQDGSMTVLWIDYDTSNHVKSITLF